MEAKYTINGVEYTQTFLTLGDIKKLVDAFDEIDLANLNAMHLFTLLLKKNLHQVFFNAILKGEKPIDVDAMEFDQAVEVVSDFLSSSRFSKMLSMIFSIVGNLTGEMTSILSKMATPATGTI